MKIRKGFVSNSSSSSFICCYARIEDENKAMKYLSKTSEEYEVLSTEDAIAKSKGWSSYGCDWAGVYCEPNIIKDADYKYLSFESFGGAGDSDYDFTDEDDEDCFDLDYDVDYDDFEKHETDFIDGITEENGFTDINIGYGAGRNG